MFVAHICSNVLNNHEIKKNTQVANGSKRCSLQFTSLFVVHGSRKLSLPMHYLDRVDSAQ